MSVENALSPEPASEEEESDSVAEEESQSDSDGPDDDQEGNNVYLKSDGVEEEIEVSFETEVA
jgi:hypothetical protein